MRDWFGGFVVNFVMSAGFFITLFTTRFLSSILARPFLNAALRGCGHAVQNHHSLTLTKEKREKN